MSETKNYIMPRAKKNLHQCKYHLEQMENSRNIEEVEINFAAFVISARSVTFVLQKEFSRNEKFIEWYGEIKGEEIICTCCGKKREILKNLFKIQNNTK